MLLDITGSNNDISKVKYSPDISIKNNLAIMIKSHSVTTEIVKMKLLNLVKVKDKSVEGLFTSLTFEMSNHGLQIQNLVDFAADTTNVMFNEHSSKRRK